MNTGRAVANSFRYGNPCQVLAEVMRVGGSYPWRLDNGFTTILHLKNTIAKPVFALVQVRYQGGSYNLERLPLQPYQTIAVDLRALRDRQQPDIRDAVMPKEIDGGQLVWFEETVGSLIGRAEIANPQAGVASSFSCPEPCQCPPSFSTAFLTPTSSVGPVGGTAQFTANERRQDCHGALYGPYNRTGDSTWHSDNTSVFTVGAGTVSCLQPGNGNVTAQFTGTIYTRNCFITTTNPTVGGPVVVKPKIDSLAPARGVQGIAYNLTITGKGFKDPATVSVAGTGITVSGTQVGSSSEIITTLTIAGDATGGNHAVTVMVSNQTSNSVNFYVQIPTKLRRDSISNLIDQQGGCGAHRDLQYTLMDQQTMAQPIDIDDPITETFSNFTSSNPGISAPAETSRDLQAGALPDFVGYEIPTCPPPFTAEMDQTFVVKIGNKTYPLTTKNHIKWARDAAGTKTVDVTITTP